MGKAGNMIASLDLQAVSATYSNALLHAEVKFNHSSRADKKERVTEYSLPPRISVKGVVFLE
jgi:hypothetical protein